MIPPLTWNEFLEFISDILDNELNTALLSQYIKIPDKSMTSFQVMEYFKSDFQKAKIKRKYKWGYKEKYFLIWCISKLMEKLQINIDELYQCKVFETLSTILDISEEFLLTKWLSLLNYKLQKKPWQQEEDELLIKLRQQYLGPKDWIKITKEFIKRTQTVRYPKQIRERFHNVINPSINKNEFTQDEILIIIREAQNKNKNWARISKILSGRTDNQIKNIYNSTIRKIINEIGYNSDNQVDEQQILNHIIQQNNYDPKHISSIIEETKRKKLCVKIESNSDNSQTSQMHVNNFPIQMVYPQINNQQFNFQNIYFSYPLFQLLPHYSPLRYQMFYQT